MKKEKCVVILILFYQFYEDLYFTPNYINLLKVGCMNELENILREITPLSPEDSFGI